MVIVVIFLQSFEIKRLNQLPSPKKITVWIGMPSGYSSTRKKRLDKRLGLFPDGKPSG